VGLSNDRKLVGGNWRDETVDLARPRGRRERAADALGDVADVAAATR
jgi:hypothetical protein